MKKLAIIAFALCSSPVSANLWGLCPGVPVTGMIPCDASCFGSASMNLGMAYTEAEVSLQSAFYENINSWASMNNVFLDYVADYYNRVNSSNSNRITAQDGVSKSVMASLELLSQTHSRNIENFVESYRILHKDMRLADLVRDNTKSYASERTSPTGDYLLVKIDEYAEDRAVQGNLDVINEIHKNKSKYINSSEQSLLIAQSAHAAEDELTIMDFPQLVVDGELNEKQLEITLKTIFALYLNKGAVDTAAKKLQVIKREMALDALSKTFRFINEETKLDSMEEELRQLDFQTVVSGRNTMAFKHTLKQEHVFQKAVENKLLNSYLKQVKTNNALKIINNN